MPDTILFPRLPVDLVPRLLRIEELLELLVDTLEARHRLLDRRLTEIEAQTPHYGVGRGGLACPP